MKFYGVCANYFKLDDEIWEAIEDEADGYRSYLEDIKVVDNPEGLVFSGEPFDEVYKQEVYDGHREGFEYRSTKDDHLWLFVGTDYTDDYYPLFVFHYTPRI